MMVDRAYSGGFAHVSNMFWFLTRRARFSGKNMGGTRSFSVASEVELNLRGFAGYIPYL